MSDDMIIYTAIIVMAVITFATRIAGAEMMTFFRVTARFQAFLNAMASSVLVAIVATEVAKNGIRESTAIFVAALVMTLTRSAIVAMSAGVITAALWSRVLI